MLKAVFIPGRRAQPRVAVRSAALIALLGAAGLAACGGGGEDESAVPAETASEAGSVQADDRGEAAAEAAVTEAPRALTGTLPWALAGPWRPPEERARDGVLRPVATAEFFGLDSAASVLELHPGRGAWTAIIAPTVAARGGVYVLAPPPADAGGPALELRAGLAERFADEALFGPITLSALGPSTGPLADPGSMAAAFSVDDVAAWMALGHAEKAFADVYAALAPGGRFGVIQPRAAPAGAQDPAAASGYVQQAYVVRLAEEAGFELLEVSERLANAADTRDHPFGVWTLAPYRLTAPLGEPADPSFDREPFDAVGEPDRMTLMFRKPFPEPAAEGGGEDTSNATADGAD